MHRDSSIYTVLRFWLRLTLKMYYREIKVVGNPNGVPAKYPVIFAPNHQNAFVDAILVHYAANRQSVSLTRSDVFSNPKLAGVFRHLKMMPVYRPRDGGDIVAQNKKIFDQCAQLLRDKGNLLIFPEGNHGAEFRLRNLQKGFARIGFQAESEADFKLGLHIVPVSINYERHDLFNGALMISYGEPIRLDDYRNEFREHPQQAYKIVRNRLQKEIRKNLIHISVKGDQYSLLDDIRRIFFDRKTDWKSQIEFLESAQEKVGNEQFDSDLREAWKAYSIYAEEVNAPNKKSPKSKPATVGICLSAVLVLIQMVLSVPGYLFHKFSFTVSEKIVEAKFKDRQFHNGVKMVLAQVSTLFFYCILFLVLLAAGLCFTYSCGVIALIFLSGIMAKYCMINLKSWQDNRRFARLSNKQFQQQKEKQELVLKMLS